LSDADSDARVLVAVGTSTNGAMVAIVGNWIFYAPSDTDPNRNTPDHFDYTITDGFSGGTVTNQVCISLIGPDPGSQPPVMSKLAFLANQVLVRFSGIPGYTYHLERSPILGAAANWSDLGSATTDGAGNAEFIDPAPLPDHAFYRAVWR